MKESGFKISGNTSVPWLWIACVASIAFACYVNTLGHGWAYDDMYVIENVHVTEPGHVSDIFTTTYHYGRGQLHSFLWRPLTIFSYYLNRIVFGTEPWSFHLVNVLLHTLCSVLVLALAWGYGRSVAFLAALIFASHPVHTEVVANVFGRSEMLLMLFWVSTFLLWYWRKKSKWFYPLSLLTFSLGILCKETIAVLPLMMILVRVGEIFRGETGKKLSRTDFIETGAYFAIILFYLALRGLVIQNLGAPPPISPYANPLVELSFSDRLPTALGVITRYFLLLLFPLRLSADYSFNQIPAIGFIHPLSIAGLLIIAAVLAACIFSIRRSKTVYESLLLLSLPFIVFSNILFTIGTIMGERLLYLPSMGYSILAAKVLTVLFGKRNELLKVIAVIIIVLFSARTFIRNPVWKSDEALYSRTAETSPASGNIALRWGADLYKMGRYAEAIKEDRRLLEIDPNLPDSWQNLGAALIANGQFDEAIELYKKATLFTEQQRYQYIGTTYKMMGKNKEAEDALRKSYDLDPSNGEVAMNLGIVLSEQGKYDEAMNIYREQSLKDPGDYHPWVLMAQIHMARNDWKNEEDCLREAVKASPSDPYPNNLLLSRFASRGLKEKTSLQLDEMRAKGLKVDPRLTNQIQTLIGMGK